MATDILQSYHNRITRLKNLLREARLAAAGSVRRKADLERWRREHLDAVAVIDEELADIPTKAILMAGRISRIQLELSTVKANLERRKKLNSLKTRRAKVDRQIRAAECASNNGSQG